MPSDEVLEQRRRRRAWWLRVARDAKRFSQAGVAVTLGMSKNSASTVSDWEQLESDPSLRQLELLAALYDVPLSLFTDPPPTDEERLREWAAAALEHEQQAWESEEVQGPTTDDEPDGPPHRRSV